MKNKIKKKNITASIFYTHKIINYEICCYFENASKKMIGVHAKRAVKIQIEDAFRNFVTPLRLSGIDRDGTIA